MKKLLLAILICTLSTGTMFAQTAKPAQEKHKATKKVSAATQHQPSATSATATPAAGSTAKKVKKDGTTTKSVEASGEKTEKH